MFAGDSEIDQIFRIMRKLGTPTPEQWPLLTKLPDYSPSFPQFRGKVRRCRWGVHCGLGDVHAPPHRDGVCLCDAQSWKTIAPGLDDAGLDLLSHMLCFDPAHRWAASEALAHPYFAEYHYPGTASAALASSVAAGGAGAGGGAGDSMKGPETGDPAAPTEPDEDM